MTIKPNIIIITIDSFNADKCFGEKALPLPNINSLIDKGVYCSNTFTSVPGTIGSLGCLFTGDYPFKSGINIFQHHAKTEYYFEILKFFSYNMYSTLPDFIYFDEITKTFNDKDVYEGYGTLDQIGEKILKRLESKKMNNPWLYYIHLMDLHEDATGKFRTPEKFNDEKYGSSEYDRNLFSVDHWLGRIFEKINFENTIVVLTADHPHNETLFKNKKIENFIIKCKFLGPRFYNFGKKLIKLTRILSKQQKNMFILPDKQLKIPLIFAGYGINDHKIIHHIVRNIDIFPTISDIIELPKKKNVDGRSLLPLFQGKELEEIPAYVENKKISQDLSNDAIGVRTSNYKYYRNKNNLKSNVHLYDLTIDPNETKNIAKKEPRIVLQMEKILEEIKENSANHECSDTSDEETKKIQEELKKLGYI